VPVFEGPQVQDAIGARLAKQAAIALIPPEPDCSPIAYSVDVHNDAVVVWQRGVHPDRWLISRQHEQTIFATVETAARSWSHILVQPLPDGEMLLATSRSTWRPSGPDRNAVVIDSSGRAIVEGLLGDGISDVLTDSQGNIWVGYYDEGVMGSAGWNGPGPIPIGNSGLVRFDHRLEKAWSYQSMRDDDRMGRLPRITDCYALNVTDDVVLAYTYTSWSIIQIRRDLATSQETNIRGANQLVHSGETYALLGGYNHESNRVTIGTLAKDRLTQVVSGTSDVLQRPKWGTSTTVVSRGAQLNNFSYDTWTRTVLGAIPESR
jgi:hypothetical protein